MGFEKGESASQFIARLSNTFDRYVQLSEIEKLYEKLKKSYEKLKELMVQFISVFDPELALFLKERDPKTLEQAKLLADRYLDARLFKRSSAKTQSVTNFVEGESKSQYSSTSHSKMDSKMGGQGGAYVTQKAPMASDRRCFICNKGGHLARNCKNRFGNVASNKTEKKEFANVFTESQVELLKIENLPLAQGKVFGIAVNVLRDTECTTVLVKKQFVPGCALTGLKKSLILLDGTSRQTPIARVCIESPIFSGTIEAL